MTAVPQDSQRDEEIADHDQHVRELGLRIGLRTPLISGTPPTFEPARVCGFCGDRDPRWYGTEASGWRKVDGRDQCPTCKFVGWSE